jgi:hemerythrin superfamily protein
MNALIDAASPYATNMIRLDHTHVLATFHQYKTTSIPRVKQGLVNTSCLALEIHAQLEEEIFYPALRDVFRDETLEKSPSEHSEMRRLIALLRSMEPDDMRYDDTYMELMRDVLHHVADEETVLLPAAERLLQGELGALGRKMTARRMQLVAPRSGSIALNMARATRGTTVLLMAALLAGGAWAGYRMSHR